MTSILTRFKDIMSANINQLLDKAEDPEKMIDQYLRNLQSDLGKVKAETAAVMAEEARAKRELVECEEEIEKYTNYAKKALEQDNENDAKQFLNKKVGLQRQCELLTTQAKQAAENSIKMRELHEKLSSDMADLEHRRMEVKTKMKLAENMNRANAMSGGGVGKVESNMDAFKRMEEKADRIIDEANAMAELNRGKDDDLADLEAKYDDAIAEAPVEEELAKLKRELGKE